jgi:hypothetical protein
VKHSAPANTAETVQNGGSGRCPKRAAGPTFGHGKIPVERAVHDGGPDFQHQMSAPRGDHLICRWAFIRRCNSHCTVISVTAEIGSSRRRAVA